MYGSSGTDRKGRCRRTERDRVPLIDQIRNINGAKSGGLVVALSSLVSCAGSSVIGFAGHGVVTNSYIVEDTGTRGRGLA